MRSARKIFQQVTKKNIAKATILSSIPVISYFSYRVGYGQGKTDETKNSQNKLNKETSINYLFRQNRFFSPPNQTSEKLPELNKLTKKELGELQHYVQEYKCPEEFRNLIRDILYKKFDDMQIKIWLIDDDKNITELFDKLFNIYRCSIPYIDLVLLHEHGNPNPVCYLKNDKPMTQIQLKASQAICHQIIAQLQSNLANKLKAKSVILEYDNKLRP